MVAADSRQHHQDRAIGQENEQNKPFSSCDGLFRGAGADQEAHQQSEIVAGDVEEIALVNVITASQPGPAHAAAIEGEREAALDDLGPELEGLPGGT